jgi:hypothetical protein
MNKVKNAVYSAGRILITLEGGFRYRDQLDSLRFMTRSSMRTIGANNIQVHGQTSSGEERDQQLNGRQIHCRDDGITKGTRAFLLQASRVAEDAVALQIS